MIVKNNKFNRNIVYEEPGPKRIELIGKYHIIKSYKSWKESKKTIKDLIENEVHIKNKSNKRRIWISTAHKTIKNQK